MKRWLFLLRAFFPSWKFFDEVGTEMTLQVRYGANESQLSEWENCLPPIQRNWKNLFFNSAGNLLHASHTLLRLLYQETLDHSPEELMARPVYKTVKNLADHQVRLKKVSGGEYLFQFRLIAGTDLLTSPLYES